MKFVGIEPSISIAKYANKKGLKTINSFFNEKIIKRDCTKIRKPHWLFLRILLVNIKNIAEFLKTVKNLISSNGIFVIETGYHPKQMENKCLIVFIMSIFLIFL